MKNATRRGVLRWLWVVQLMRVEFFLERKKERERGSCVARALDALASPERGNSSCATAAHTGTMCGGRERNWGGSPVNQLKNKSPHVEHQISLTSQRETANWPLVCIRKALGPQRVFGVLTPSETLFHLHFAVQSALIPSSIIKRAASLMVHLWLQVFQPLIDKSCHCHLV